MIAKLKQELEDSKQETLIAYADRQTSMRIAKNDVLKAKVIHPSSHPLPTATPLVLSSNCITL